MIIWTLYHKSKSYLKWKTTFKETSSLNTKGSILLVHGLNNNNHVFKELEELFLSNESPIRFSTEHGEVLQISDVRPLGPIKKIGSNFIALSYKPKCKA